MKKKNEPKIWIVATLFMALMVASAFAVLAIGIVTAATWYVEEGESIQAAVDAANHGDTIIVRDGTYTENIKVNKRLTIRSENGSDSTIVQSANPSANPDDVFEVTTGYVTINGFTIKNATGPWEVGIHLCINADHCNISENNCSNNDMGIKLCFRSNNNIINNTLSNNYQGIFLSDSSSNNLMNNNLSNNDYGIYLAESSNNMVTNNTFVNDGLFVGKSYQNIVESNTVNGKPLVYLENESDLMIADAGQVILVNCDNITVKKLNLSNTDVGAELWRSNNSKLMNCTINSNSKYGYNIYLYSSSNNMITNTNVLNNDYGIYLHSSNNNVLTNNTANSSHHYGIYLHSSNNNVLTNNTASNNYNGIRLCSSSDNTLMYNNASGNKYGICIASSSNNMLTNNSASNNYDGICLSGNDSSNNLITNNSVNSNEDVGIELSFWSDNNVITNNIVSLNDWCGTKFWQSSNNILMNNNISNNHNGICLSSSNNNKITNNTVSSSNHNGIQLSASFNSNIYLNNFINNSQNAYSYGSSTNIWNSTEKITYAYNETTYTNYLGNYWDDYKEKYPDAEEIDESGIWDTPYSINSDNDTYPLVELWENYFKPPEENVFDTGSPANPYPSIRGTHNGTITPSHDIYITKMYTYPCFKTGGHTEFVAFYNSTTEEEIANATWIGSYLGNYHWITFDKPLTLKEGVIYNYTIRTGSYPQIIHETPFNARGGTITCTEFIDANGRIYDDWIPAIRLGAW